MKILLLIAVVFCCVGSFAGSPSLVEALKLVPGKVTKQQLVQLFGKPSEKNTFKEPPTGESWEYREDGLERLTLFFDEASDTLDSWAWGLNKDPEKDLKVAKARFPNATWTAETEK